MQVSVMTVVHVVDHSWKRRRQFGKRELQRLIAWSNHCNCTEKFKRFAKLYRWHRLQTWRCKKNTDAWSETVSQTDESARQMRNIWEKRPPIQQVDSLLNVHNPPSSFIKRWLTCCLSYTSVITLGKSLLPEHTFGLIGNFSWLSSCAQFRKNRATSHCARVRRRFAKTAPPRIAYDCCSCL